MDMLTWWNDAERGEVGQSFCLALYKANIMLPCRIHASCTLTGVCDQTGVCDPYHHVTASPHLFQICAVTCIYTTLVFN